MSAARWQPKGFNYPTLSFFGTWDPDTGDKMVHLAPDDFRETYERVLDNNGDEIAAFFGRVKRQQIVLVCWCEFVRQWHRDRLYCHTILVGYYLEVHYPELEVIYADGRDKSIWEKRNGQTESR